MKYKPKLPARQDAPLPVPMTGTALQLPETAQLDEELSQLIEAVDALEGLNDSDPIRAIAVVEAAIPTMGELWLRWAPVDRPATADEVLVQVDKLLTNFPLAGNIDPVLRTNVLFEDIAALRPNYYSLDTACRAVRNACEFFSQPKLVKELRLADGKARRYRKVLNLDAGEIQEALSSAKEKLAQRRVEAEKSRQREKAHRARLKKMDPVIWREFFGDEENDR
jgi:hypothetical protein